MGDENAKKQSSVSNTGSYSLSGRVFHRIREDILSGKYPNVFMTRPVNCGVYVIER